MRNAASLILLASAMSIAHACSVVKDINFTFYGYKDNSPPGDGVAYNCGGRNYHAGGSGTYADPLTFASAPGEYNQCEIVYAPYLKKYLRMEDTCDACSMHHSCSLHSTPSRCEEMHN